MMENIPCLILPVKNKNLLLPTSAVSEIVHYEEPRSMADIPAWLLGILVWRGIHIPLTYLEKMEAYSVWGGQEERLGEEDKRKFHIAIINRMYKFESQEAKVNQYPFFSIVLRGSPKLCRVSKEDISLRTESRVADPRFIIEVKVQNEHAWIPDLTALWKMIDTLPSRLQWFRQISL